MDSFSCLGNGLEYFLLVFRFPRLGVGHVHGRQHCVDAIETFLGHRRFEQALFFLGRRMISNVDLVRKVQRISHKHHARVSGTGFVHRLWTKTMWPMRLTLAFERNEPERAWTLLVPCRLIVKRSNLHATAQGKHENKLTSELT
eukprot:g76268.t1